MSATRQICQVQKNLNDSVQRERCLPSNVTGPVLFNALRWLAPFLAYQNSLKVGPDELGSFRHQFSVIVLVKSSLA